MRLNLYQAINEIKESQDNSSTLRDFLNEIIIHNNRIKVERTLKSQKKALELAYLLNYKIKDFYDGAFFISLMYYDETKDLKSLTMQFQKASRAHISDACLDADGRFSDDDEITYQR